MLFTMLGKITFYLFFAILLTLMLQKRYGLRGERKRLATLYLGIAAMFLYAATFLPQVPDIVPPKLAVALFLAVLIGAAVMLYIHREKTFPHRFHCRSCGSKLPLERGLFIDSNLCEPCEKNEKVTP